MTNPTINEKNPISVQLEAGKTYAWCRCGLSRASHSATVRTRERSSVP